MSREFKEGVTYYVESGPINKRRSITLGNWSDLEPGFAIFRPTHTQSDSDNHIIICDMISNMNKHWGGDNKVFIRKSDGVSTYPWSSRGTISVSGRQPRIATPLEKFILDCVIEKGEVLTPDEIRDIRINNVLKTDE